MPRKIGCAGWSLPREYRAPPLSYLERYAQLFNSVEVNSSFYRHHRPQTYERWASVVPESFQFSVKVPKAISHSELFQAGVFERFADEVGHLGSKLGALLFQFPPALECSSRLLKTHFEALRREFPLTPAFCEPRHASWFNADVEAILHSYAIDWAVADPKVVSNAPSIFGGRPRRYYRLHGTPRIYYSSYSSTTLRALAQQTLRREEENESWIIFDNTAAGAAFEDARTFERLLAEYPEQRGHV
jgi:uncharacterized protein YecE (DUF72 family)